MHFHQINVVLGCGSANAMGYSLRDRGRSSLRAEADPQPPLSFCCSYQAAILIVGGFLDQSALLKCPEEPVRCALRQTCAPHHVAKPQKLAVSTKGSQQLARSENGFDGHI